MTPARAALKPSSQPVELDHRVDVGAVQDERGEAADGVQVVVREGAGELVGVGRQEAVRAELGGGEADLVHLAEHLVGGQLVAPAGDLADTPADGCAGDAVDVVGHCSSGEGAVLSGKSHSELARAVGRRPASTSATPWAAAVKVARVAPTLSPMR